MGQMRNAPRFQVGEEIKCTRGGGNALILVLDLVDPLLVQLVVQHAFLHADIANRPCEQPLYLILPEEL